MRRGELYLVQHPSSRDPRRQRVFVIVSRQLLVNSSFSSVICAPVYTRRDGLHTQVDIGIEEGLRHESSIHCDEILGGTQVFVGTRVPVKNLFDYLEAGDSLEIFLDDFSSVTRTQAVAALELAREALAADARPA